MADLLEGLQEEALLEELPPTLSSRVLMLDAATQDAEEVGRLLAAAPMAGISLKGTARWDENLWSQTKREFYAFLCTDAERYEDLRSEWTSHRENGVRLAVGALSGVVGAHVGVAGGVVAPMVIWLLVAAVRVGKNGFCSAWSPPPEDADPSPSDDQSS